VDRERESPCSLHWRVEHAKNVCRSGSVKLDGFPKWSSHVKAGILLIHLGRFRFDPLAGRFTLLTRLVLGRSLLSGSGRR
jgi:hypothetical protein